MESDYSHDYYWTVNEMDTKKWVEYIKFEVKTFVKKTGAKPALHLTFKLYDLIEKEFGKSPDTIFDQEVLIMPGTGVGMRVEPDDKRRKNQKML